MTDPAGPRSHAHAEPGPLRRFAGLVRRPRLSFAVVIFAVLAGALSWLPGWRLPTALLVAWNGSVLLYLAATLHMMARSDAETTLRRARRLDENAALILLLSAAAATASLVGVVAELGVVKDQTGLTRALHVGLAAGTVVVSWCLTQVMFAIHYAHVAALGRAEGGDGGLRIPGEEHPDYWDFLYAAVAIGTSGQTADVEFTAKRARRVALVHSTLAFFFNTTVLALAINIAAGLI
ncbi:MAG: DUF1345 domain-containing protein [Phyllobacteriaceae bacterium]|nr:DUF1345 domain-containing protein [Phyllobacteriaceae bacterium]